MHTDPWLVLNWALRGGAIVLPLVLGALLLRQHAQRVSARLGAAFALGASAFALHTGPGFGAVAALWKVPAVSVATANTLVFWLFTRSLLEDDFRLRPWHAVAWVAFAALAAVDCGLGHLLGGPVARAVGVAIASTTVALALLAVTQAAASWRADLVETRRRLRFFVVVGVGGHILLMQLIAAVTRTDLPSAFASIGNAAALLALNVALVWRMLRFPGDTLFAGLAAGELPTPDPVREPGVPMPAPGLPAVPSAAASADDPAPDPRWIEALNELMAVEQVYREDSLTIGSLAARMKLPEHRLRRLINQGLGHRNFHAFLNQYRVDDAKRALGDAAFDAVPILTIAMEAGFQSIGPFNRAFKAATGMTPTDYRRQSRVGVVSRGESTFRPALPVNG